MNKPDYDLFIISIKLLVKTYSYYEDRMKFYGEFLFCDYSFPMRVETEVNKCAFQDYQSWKSMHDAAVEVLRYSMGDEKRWLYTTILQYKDFFEDEEFLEHLWKYVIYQSYKDKKWINNYLIP